MRSLLLALSASLLLLSGAEAQTPQRVATATTSVTISVSDTFQQALASASRNSCTIQYKGTHTGYVYFGTTANATETKAFTLAQGQSVNCLVGGVVLTDAVQVTATAGDVFAVTQQ